jgi:hypothetical protein
MKVLAPSGPEAASGAGPAAMAPAAACVKPLTRHFAAARSARARRPVRVLRGLQARATPAQEVMTRSRQRRRVLRGPGVP